MKFGEPDAAPTNDAAQNAGKTIIESAPEIIKRPKEISFAMRSVLPLGLLLSLLWVLISLNIWAIVASAVNYLEFTKSTISNATRMDQNGEMLKSIQVGYIVFSVTWFAFVGLLTTVVAKTSTAIMSEIRLSTTRQYLNESLKTIIHINGVSPNDLLNFLNKGAVMQQDNRTESDEKFLLPMQKNIHSIKNLLVELVGKKDS